MKLTIIGKYPPIEGGVSSRMYWLARSLAERGMQVDVITNAARVERGYRIPLDLADPQIKRLYEPENLQVFSLTEPPPHHIPYSEAYLSRLVNLGLRIIAERGSDLIYANYLEPYGTAALYLSRLTGVPYAVQHAGSDIYRLLPHEDFGLLLGKVLQEADGVFMAKRIGGLAVTLGISDKNLFRIFGRTVDTRAFSPDGSRFDFSRLKLPPPPAGVPLITYIGKIGRFKGLKELFGGLRKLSSDFRLLLVCDGEVPEKLDALLAEDPGLAQKIIRTGFLPPWEIPSVLRSSALLVHLEHDFPVPIHSPLQPFEAIATGTPLFLSGEMHAKMRPLFPDTGHLLPSVSDPRDAGAVTAALERMLSAIEQKRSDALRVRDEMLKRSDWNTYVENYESSFLKLAERGRSSSR